MIRKLQILLYISLFFTIISTAENGEIKSARIESCPGCSLNRLPEVKKFIYEDVPKYDQVEFKKISGAAPEMVFLDGLDKELERLPLSKLSRKECNDLLIKHGFKLSEGQDKHEF